MVETELADPRIGLVTFTGATMSPDLRQARIYYSALGDEEAKRRAADGLARATGYLRREIGRRLGLRFSPTLSFEPDRSLERADRIERLLRSSPNAEQTSDDDSDAS